MKQNKPSSTAMFVSSGMYYNIHQKHLGQDISEGVKKYNLKLIEYVYGIKGGISKRWRLFHCTIMQAFSIKGFFLHFLVRKKCIEKQVCGFIEQGFEQVIVLGAGYDTLCTRLSDNYPNIKFIELDHPATADDKISIFKELGWNRSNIEYLAHDLKSNEAFCDTNKINKTLKTVFICEGVLMYLQQSDFEKILDTINKNFKNDCRFVFTFMEESEPGNYMFKNAMGFVKLYLKLKNEPFTWGIKPEHIGDFLKKHSWQLLELYDHKKLTSNFLSKTNQHRPVAIGEDIAVCVKL